MRAVSTLGRFRLLVPALLVAGMSGCLPYAQEQGDYVLTPVEIYRDECGLAANREPFRGTLQVTGRVVRLDFSLLDSELIGYFLDEGDDFSIDGSVVNASAEVNGQECLLDQVNIHLEGKTRCETQFDGTLRVRYDTQRPDECVCELWLRYEAVKESKRCE
ncbi:hypothetical protein HPC49_20570 [Pyxidicoccus fallax]|uniref:Lipoprotein n=1 Tax=Pyxidicoccus fallax TaxID=394095 RepID=A0A848LSZ0_9BACT|nr:hypothetical protein [Pyxidicoccus fallax]NPC80607.1 hypothetical protein [Pyxidicoccus fallax]